ncbi:S8 family serine peptidase [Solimonas variicoloris]|uniref:S8 family serine peptidase n=1 Tax=Solimonas variicoloris TaxID=254408 RepID=UPI00036C6179|nr:S8 family serine peptidase [Solimonas variicoloris]
MRHLLTGLVAALLATSTLGASHTPPERLHRQTLGAASSSASASRYTLQLTDASLDDRKLGAALAKAAPGAKLRWRSRLWPQFAIVEAPEDSASRLQRIPGVSGVQLARYTPAAVARSTGKTTTAVPRPAPANSAALAELPLSNDPLAGNNVRVGIISTGIDYTHAALGGPGTQAAYDSAWANAAAPFDGFPTDVVVGGIDLAAESNLASRGRNPIDSKLPWEDRGFVYPTGRGTYLASIVHRLAPGAKLVALKGSAVFESEGARVLKYELEAIAAAFEAALDPNLDGDTSDHVDVLLYDDDAGSFAYYDPGSTSPSPDSMIAAMVAGVAARGIPVVVGSGELIFDTPYSIAHAGAVPDAVTVGGLQRISDADVVTSFSGRGPVRGTARFLKPELVSDSVSIDGATVGSADGMEVRTGVDAAAARIAAALAILKQQRPSLSSLELKAALVNTGTRDVGHEPAHPDQPADVSRSGLGRENLEGAIATPLLAWDEDTRQPSIYLGFKEVSGTQRYVRHLRIRNLSNQAQSYSLQVQRVGEKPGFSALKIEAPVSAQVPAGSSISIPVAFELDAAKLPPWTLRETGDFSAAKWSQAELSGYLVLSRPTAPDVAVSWLLMARAKTSITKFADTMRESYSSQFWQQYLGIDETFELTQDFRNDNLHAADFAVYPVVARVDYPEYDKQRASGNMLRYVGVRVFDEAGCSSGQKLSIAASFFSPAAIALANYFERGSQLLYWEITPNPFRSDVTTDTIGYGWVEIDAQGQPFTTYIDLTIPYDPSNPTGRYRRAKLPAKMASHTRNVVSEVCLDELYHDDVTSPAAFDARLRWVFSTDRDAIPRQENDLFLHNPMRPGYDALLREPDGSPSNYVERLGAAGGATLTLTGAKQDGGIGPMSEGRLYERDGFLLISLTDDFALFSPIDYSEVSSVAAPRADQTFSVREDAASGTVLGRIETDVEQFFGIGKTSEFYRLVLAGAVPGDPFSITDEGDLVLSNPAGLDHEMAATLIVPVYAQYGQALGVTVDLAVQVMDVNDNSPEWIGEGSALPDAATKTPYRVALGASFRDADGTPLTYTASDLPAGLALDAMTGDLHGTPTLAGDFSVTIKADDGERSAEKVLALKVRGTDVVHKDGGGAWSPAAGLLLVVMAGLRATLRRRTKRAGLVLGLLSAGILSAAGALPAHAAEEPSRPQPRSSTATALKGGAAAAHLRDEHGRALYFVHLKDEPLARYDGRLKNLAATSLAASAGRNATKRGVLDVKSARSIAYLDYLQARQASALSGIQRKIGRAAAPRQQFRIALNALTLYLSEAEAQSLRGLAAVRTVERAEPRYLQTDRGPQWIGARNVWAGVPAALPTQGEGIIVGVIDTGIRPEAPSFAAVGGDGYQHRNPLGDGVYLGDCVPRPDLCNDKLIGIVSYEEITSSYAHLREPNGIDYNGHGTHTASTVAGNVLSEVPIYNALGQLAQQSFPQISGVAPHANIVSYQVCFPGDGDPCVPDMTVLAVEHAIEHGVRVLNYSIGGPIRSPWESADGLAFLSAREAGIHVAVSAGNNGPDASTISSPGNAPWVTTVAASTHDRAYTSKTIGDFSGGVPPSTITGRGVTGGYTGGVVDAARYGDALCQAPFSAGTFAGQIVICSRGQNARVEKGANVLAGGAGGMILANVDSAADDVIEDFHVLPAIHVDFASGTALRNWLASDSGAPHLATISASAPAPDPSAADIVADFSSRGPALPYKDWTKPDIAAPGVNIYAAFSPDLLWPAEGVYPAPYGFLSGTSMASPHVAGTLALLAAAHPDWTPAEAQSALVATAKADMRTESGEAAGVFEVGTGRVRAEAALQAGLLLHEDATRYQAADPQSGGSPGTLNLPSLVAGSCVLQCRWIRTVRAARAGTYTASTSTDVPNTGIAVEPASFTLAAGQTQALTVTLAASGSASAGSVGGSVELRSDDATQPTLRFPVRAELRTSDVPAYTRITATGKQGTQRIEGLQSTGGAVQYGLWGWSIAQRYPATLFPDPTPDDFVPDHPESLQVVPLEVRSNTKLLVVRIVDATANDLDLFIGLDGNLNGRPDVAESASFYCMSADDDADEECVIVDPQPGSYWIAVHNYEGNAAGDTHALVVAQVRNGVNGLTMSGPASTTFGEPYAVDIGWNLPALRSADTAFAVFSARPLDAVGTDNGPFGIVELARTEDGVTVDTETTELLSGAALRYTLQLAGSAQATTVDVEIPEPLSVESAEGASVDGARLRWTLPAGASATQYALVLATSAVQLTQTVALPVEYRLGDGEARVADVPSVRIEGYPQARIDGAASLELQARRGETLTLTTAGSSGALDGDTLQFRWQQTAGPAAPIVSAPDGGYTLAIPDAAAGQTLRYALVASNGRRESEPATLSVTVAASGGGGGGAMDAAGLLGLLAVAAICRRRRS